MDLCCIWVSSSENTRTKREKLSLSRKRGTNQEEHRGKDNPGILQRVYNETLRIKETRNPSGNKSQEYLGCHFFFFE